MDGSQLPDAVKTSVLGHWLSGFVLQFTVRECSVKIVSLISALIASISFAVTCIAADAAATRPAPFAIQIVDEQTGRGVPLVDLKTTSNVHFFTDSAGYAAIDDPAMLSRRVYFWISSHGYEYAADGF